MRLSIITVNYNSSGSTLKLLESLQNQTDKNFHIFVIDNASDEADFNNLQSHIWKLNFHISTIRNVHNLGFSGGNNVGIKKALENGADWMFLLNNDTWVQSDFIASLMAKLEGLECLSEDKRGIAGVALDEDEHIAYAGRITWLRSRGYHIYSTEKAELAKNKYIIGGAMAVHKKVFERIGFLDEKYFLYFEDQDFSLRAKSSGFLLSFFHDLKVNHSVSATTEKIGAPLLLRYHYRNSLYFNWKNGPWYIKILVWPWSFWIMKKQLFKLMFQYKPVESWAILAGVIDFYKNRMGKIN